LIITVDKVPAVIAAKFAKLLSLLQRLYEVALLAVGDRPRLTGAVMPK
jgi:hypothetical protein